MQTVFNLFVYGSLRKGFKNPAYNYVSRYFSLISNNAKAKGLLFNMGNFPVAKPTANNKFITGELYTIINKDEFSFAIAQLDDYEGVYAEENEKPLYYREKTIVYFENVATEAWVYWFNGEVNGKQIIESGDVLQFFSEQQKGS
ncbi:MAG TPA: gamma-glutamylcyclotransferase [Chitinophagaceae bacterium]|nr:gamma-glutamylcyclotransferase [Chitinophagaceae bacterium]HNM34169.1 gamma-glutamylcyclotransferase [Chitinophagaceae bacterium]